MPMLFWFLDADFYLWIAILGSAMFIIKLILMYMGGDAAGHGSFDHGDVSAGDVAHDVGHVGAGTADGGDSSHLDSTAVFTLFSIQGFLGFLMGFGWMGLAAQEQWHLGSVIALVMAAGFGFLMMLLSATLMYYVRRMERVIPFDLRNAIGQVGQVQFHIPAAGAGMGEVQLVVQGRQKVLKARTTGAEIPSFARVKVVAVEGDHTLTVEPI